MKKLYNNYSAEVLTKEDWIEIFNELDSCEKIEIWNKYQQENNYDEEIYDKSTFLEIVQDNDFEELLEIGVYLGSELSRDYFQCDGQGYWNGSDHPEDFIDESSIYLYFPEILDDYADIDSFLEEHRDVYSEVFDEEEDKEEDEG